MSLFPLEIMLQINQSKIHIKFGFRRLNTCTFDINFGLFSFYIRHGWVKYVLITFKLIQTYAYV